VHQLTRSQLTCSSVPLQQQRVKLHLSNTKKHNLIDINVKKNFEYDIKVRIGKFVEKEKCLEKQTRNFRHKTEAVWSNNLLHSLLWQWMLAFSVRQKQLEAARCKWQRSILVSWAAEAIGPLLRPQASRNSQFTPPDSPRWYKSIIELHCVGQCELDISIYGQLSVSFNSVVNSWL